MNYQVKAIPEDITSSVRQILVSPQYKSLAANVSVANGYGPCRSCLQVFNQGQDERIYFTYNSFDGLSQLPDPGPIFVHKNECERFDNGHFPPDLLELPVLLEGFGDESKLIWRDRMEPAEVDKQIGDIFADSDVRFINLRNAEAGCFIARVERVATSGVEG